MVAECPGPLRQLAPVCNDQQDELFGFFGDLEDLEEGNAVNIIEDGSSESVRDQASVLARRERSSSPMLGSAKGQSSRLSDGSRETPETPSTPSQDDDGKELIISHKDPEKLAKMRLLREKNREAGGRT